MLVSRLTLLSSADLDLLNGATPMVGVEAPAGAGKTHLACNLAIQWSSSLQRYQQVLFLSHTNAARDVFGRRVAGLDLSRDTIALKTLDTFCLELLNPYASLLGLPAPLRPPRPVPADWFRRARSKASALLKAKPELASAVVARFPLVIADEHQDAARQHHELLQCLATAGARVVDGALL
jgi:superfamily I DNA/RNA helicase